MLTDEQFMRELRSRMECSEKIIQSSSSFYNAPHTSAAFTFGQIHRVQLIPFTPRNVAQGHLQIASLIAELSEKATFLLEVCKEIEAALYRTRQALANAKRTSSELSNQDLPINRFPNELLCEIFRDGLKISKECGVNYLLAITSVCRQWRTIATQYTQLWNDITFFSSIDRELKPCHEFIEAQFERSGTANFTINVRLFGFPRGTDQWLVPLLHSHMHRCQSFRFWAVFGHYPEGLFPLPSDLRSLEILDVAITHDIELWRPDAFGPLRRLTITAFDLFDSSKYIPYAQLEHIALYSFHDQIDYFPIILNQSNLLSLSLSMNRTLIERNEPRESIVLPNLTQIDLLDGSLDLFPKIKAPVLRHISIEDVTVPLLNRLADVTNLGNVTSITFKNLRTIAYLDYVRHYGVGERLLGVEVGCRVSDIPAILAEYYPCNYPELQVVRIFNIDKPPMSVTMRHKIMSAIDQLLSVTADLEVQLKIDVQTQGEDSPASVSEQNKSRFTP